MKPSLSPALGTRLLIIMLGATLLLVATSAAAHDGLHGGLFSARVGDRSSGHLGAPPIYVLPGSVYVLPQPITPLHPYPVPAHRSLRPVAPPAVTIVPPRVPWVTPIPPSLHTQPYGYGYPPYTRGYGGGAYRHR